jgi:hypothetical protein
MTACAYRSLEPVLRLRVADLCRRRERDSALADVARGVASRRIGRALAGATGVFLASAMFLVALRSSILDDGERHAHVAATVLLLSAWPVACVVGALGRALAQPILSRWARVSLSGDPAVDLARLEASDPLRAACDVAMRWERRSTALPLAALSLLTPLTLHAILFAITVSTPLGERGRGCDYLEDFGKWIGLSVWIVGHAHIALLVCAVRWASRLRTLPASEMRRPGIPSAGRALVISTGVACVPGLLLLAIPPTLVLVTGALFVPLMYGWTSRTLERERTVLEATS